MKSNVINSSHTADRVLYIVGKNKWSKSLAKGRIAWGGSFTGDSVMWHRPVGSIAVVCSSPAVMQCCYRGLNDSVCCVHRSKDSQCFSVGRSTPIPVGDLDLRQIQGSLGPQESAPKRHLDRFSRYWLCTAHRCDSHTLHACSAAWNTAVCSVTVPLVLWERLKYWCRCSNGPCGRAHTCSSVVSGQAVDATETRM